MAVVGLDNERALQLLRSVRARGAVFNTGMRMPEFGSLRDNPRFQALLAKYEN